MTPYRVILALLLLAAPAMAQRTDSSASVLRIGPHAGVQTSVLRYTVDPYTGEFQSTVEQGTVYGLSLALPVSASFRLQVDLGWWTHTWSVRHDGDPAVEIDRGDRTVVEFPMLLTYFPRVLPVPVYIAAGPAFSLLADGSRTFTVSRTGFTERDGWKTSSRDYEEETLHMSIAGEAGVEAPLDDRILLQMAVRITQPLGRTVDETTFTLRELSAWRFRLGLLFSF